MSLAEKIFGTFSDRELKKINPITKKVLALEPKYQALSDADLQAQTPALKARLAGGETLDDILPDAFAVCREAAWRVLGMKHFPVQVTGGIALHRGAIAEMQTGEGKTLVATLPAYLNALTGEGVHIVTVNDYLAKRDSEWMGKLYRWLGLSVGLIVQGIDGDSRRRAYNADITYGTNNEFGFDYLRDNMVTRPEQRVQRGHNYAIVDEVDSILIDEARTPLIISGAGTKSASTYKDFARAVRGLERGEDVSHDMLTATEDVEPTGDYVMDEAKHTIAATERGLKKIERRLGIEDIYADLSGQLVNHLQQALKAQYMFHRDKQYVVTNGEVKIVDEFTGRIMEGRRYSEGLHQAIEAKEGVLVREENQTLATITLQNYFRLYDKLSGMTGTALTEDAEFREIYKLPVEVIPSNKPVQRVDHEDLVYRTIQAKYNAVADDVERRHAKGQPVLVGTVSIESSEKLSAALTKRGIAHEVLNAKHHEREAHIVAQAGRYGAVTIATNMAGRGTDILLGGNPDELVRERLEYEGLTMEDVTPEQLEQFNAEAKETCKAERERVLAAGGLTVIGTERHESRRIDNQLRGRSGRQGDPGETQFYLSLEDDLMRLFNTQLVARVMAKGMPEGEPIEAKSVSKGVRTAQKAVESRNFEIRKNVLKYDDVMNKQRTVIYAERQAVLKGADIHEDILKFIDDTVLSYIKGANNGSDKPADWDWDGLFKAISSVYPIAVEQEAAKDAVDKLKGDKGHMEVALPLEGKAAGKVVHVDRKLSNDTTSVVPSYQLEAYLDSLPDDAPISVMHCFCRNIRRREGMQPKHPTPDEVCLCVGNIAKQIIEYGVGRQVSKAEARQILVDCGKKGCVHQVCHYACNMDEETTAICNCDTQCCEMLGSYTRGGMQPLYLRAHAKPVIVHPENCNGCNICNHFCPTVATGFNAQTGKVFVEYQRCIGCGVCVTKCPKDVRKMVDGDRVLFCKPLKKSLVRERNVRRQPKKN